MSNIWEQSIYDYIQQQSIEDRVQRMLMQEQQMRLIGAQAAVEGMKTDFEQVGPITGSADSIAGGSKAARPWYPSSGGGRGGGGGVAMPEMTLTEESARKAKAEAEKKYYEDMISGGSSGNYSSAGGPVSYTQNPGEYYQSKQQNAWYDPSTSSYADGW